MSFNLRINVYVLHKEALFNSILPNSVDVTYLAHIYLFDATHMAQSAVYNYHLSLDKFMFIDFVLLLPSNLDKLPIVEPIGVNLNRFMKCENNFDLKQISSFQDWEEAWTVFQLVNISIPEKTTMLFNYFLLISKLQKDTPDLG